MTVHSIGNRILPVWADSISGYRIAESMPLADGCAGPILGKLKRAAA